MDMLALCECYVRTITTSQHSKQLGPRFSVRLIRMYKILQTTKLGSVSMRAMDKLYKLDRQLLQCCGETFDIHELECQIHHLETLPEHTPLGAATTILLAYWYLEGYQRIIRGNYFPESIHESLAFQLGIISSAKKGTPARKIDRQRVEHIFKPPIDWKALSSLEPEAYNFWQAALIELSHVLLNTEVITLSIFFRQVTQPVYHLIKQGAYDLLEELDRAAAKMRFNNKPPYHVPDWCVHCPQLHRLAIESQEHTNHDEANDPRNKLIDIFASSFPWSGLGDFLLDNRGVIPTTFLEHVEKLKTGCLRRDEFEHLAQILANGLPFPISRLGNDALLIAQIGQTRECITALRKAAHKPRSVLRQAMQSHRRRPITDDAISEALHISLRQLVKNYDHQDLLTCLLTDPGRASIPSEHEDLIHIQAALLLDSQSDMDQWTEVAIGLMPVWKKAPRQLQRAILKRWNTAYEEQEKQWKSGQFQWSEEAAKFIDSRNRKRFEFLSLFKDLKEETIDIEVWLRSIDPEVEDLACEFLRRDQTILERLISCADDSNSDAHRLMLSLIAANELLPPDSLIFIHGQLMDGPNTAHLLTHLETMGDKPNAWLVIVLYGLRNRDNERINKAIENLSALPRSYSAELFNTPYLEIKLGHYLLEWADICVAPKTFRIIIAWLEKGHFGIPPEIRTSTAAFKAGQHALELITECMRGLYPQWTEGRLPIEDLFSKLLEAELDPDEWRWATRLLPEQEEGLLEVSDALEQIGGDARELLVYIRHRLTGFTREATCPGQAWRETSNPLLMALYKAICDQGSSQA